MIIHLLSNMEIFFSNMEIFSMKIMLEINPTIKFFQLSVEMKRNTNYLLDPVDIVFHKQQGKETKSTSSSCLPKSKQKLFNN